MPPEDLAQFCQGGESASGAVCMGTTNENAQQCEGTLEQDCFPPLALISTIKVS